jgi:hypothetical protein
LKGHEGSVGGGQSIEGQQAQGRGTVYDDEVVITLDRRQRLLESTLALIRRHELNFSPHKVYVSRYEPEESHIRSDAGVLYPDIFEKDVIDGCLECALVDPKSGGCIALGIEIYEQGTSLGQS